MGFPETGLIEQAPDGTLLLGTAGERLVDHYDFYSVFLASEVYRVTHAGTTLGTLPLVTPLALMTIIFSGRCWRVAAVVDREKLIEVEPSVARRPSAAVAETCTTRWPRPYANFTAPTPFPVVHRRGTVGQFRG